MGRGSHGCNCHIVGGPCHGYHPIPSTYGDLPGFGVQIGGYGQMPTNANWRHGVAVRKSAVNVIVVGSEHNVARFRLKFKINSLSLRRVVPNNTNMSAQQQQRFSTTTTIFVTVKTVHFCVPIIRLRKEKTLFLNNESLSTTGRPAIKNKDLKVKLLICIKVYFLIDLIYS